MLIDSLLFIIVTFTVIAMRDILDGLVIIIAAIMLTRAGREIAYDVILAPGIFHCDITG